MSDAGSTDDARVEPADDLPPEERELAKALPAVAVHKARSRERVRNVVSISIVVVTLIVAATIVAASLAGAEQADNVADLVFTPLVGLSGAILGFYFGGQDSTA